MSLINKFKQANNTNLALAVGVATVATAGLAVVVYRQQKQIRRLEEISSLNSQVTLNLVNRTAGLMAARVENQ